MSYKTQNARLLAYLKRHHFITMRLAFNELDINNPWARLSELRKKHHIEDRKVKTRGGASIKQYWLVQGKQQKRVA